MNSILWNPVLWYATPLPMNRTPISTVGGPFPPFCGTPDPSRSTGSRFKRGRSNTRPFPPFCGTPGLVAIACSVQALPMNTTTTQFLHSDRAMYTSPGRTYARVGVRDPARMYVRGRIFFLAHWPLYVRVHATCVPLLRHVPFLTWPRFIAAACRQTDRMYIHVRDQNDNATYASTRWVPTVRKDKEALPYVRSY